MCFICSWNGDRSLGSVSLCRCIRFNFGGSDSCTPLPLQALSTSIKSEVENNRVRFHTEHIRMLFSTTTYEKVSQPNFLIPYMLFAARWISSAGGKKVKSCAAVETSSVRTLTCTLALFTIDCYPHTALTFLWFSDKPPLRFVPN